MLYIIAGWVFWFFFCFNIGYFVFNSLLKDKFKKVDFFYNFWFGLFILITLLEFVSLFFPLNGIVLLVLSVVNLFFLAVNIKNTKLNIYKAVRHLLQKFDYRKALVYIILALFVSFLANLPVVWYDTHLYHLNSVRWLADYGTVRGLANLHTRLGVNNITFILAAIMDNGIFNSASSHIANSFLFSVLTFQLTDYLFRKEKNLIVNLFSLFALLIMSSFVSGQINSLSTDFSLMIFVIVSVFYVLILGKSQLILATPLFVMAATSKYLYFVALILFLLFILFEYKKRIFSKENMVIFGFVFLFFVSFILRNLVISGWAFFPLTFFGIPFKWQVPVDIAKDLSNTITAWARLPGPFYMSSLGVGFWGWFINWFNNNKIGVGIYYLFLTTSLVMIYFFHTNKPRKLSFLVYANFAVLLYTFISAPDFRFMEISIFVTGSIVLSYILADILKQKSLKNLTMLTFVFLIIFNLTRAIKLENEPQLLVIQKEPSGLVEPATYTYSDQEFYLWKTINGDQCGNSQLPCTPYDVDIKEFVPGNLRSGFYPTNEKL